MGYPRYCLLFGQSLVVPVISSESELSPSTTVKRNGNQCFFHEGETATDLATLSIAATTRLRAGDPGTATSFCQGAFRSVISSMVNPRNPIAGAPDGTGNAPPR